MIKDKLLAVLLLACCCCDKPQIEVDCPSQLTSSLYYDSQALWPSTNISVCWENPRDTDLIKRFWVQDAVESTWEAEAALNFTGWGHCADVEYPNIMISIVPGPMSGTYWLGSSEFRENRIVLNLNDLELFGHFCDTDESCTRTIAVHEFGHALGFAHEQNRADTPPWCQRRQGSDGDVVIGSWDAYSVMNYCNEDWLGSGQLSCTDIQGVRTLYGPPN